MYYRPSAYLLSVAGFSGSWVQCLEQSASRRCHVRTLSADVQMPLKNTFVLPLLQYCLILLVCYADFIAVLAVALLLRPL